MKSEYERLIEALDKNLTLLRASWLEDGSREESKWKRRIDEALDERLRLMALRDAAPVGTVEPAPETQAA